MIYPIIKMTGNSDLNGHDFIGVSKNNEESIEITVPYGIDLPDLIDEKDKESVKFLKIYIKAVQKALSSKNVRSCIEQVSAGINNPIAAVKIINDYISYGPFIEYETVEKKSDVGNIDFKRTVEKITPTIFNGSFVYETYITKKKKIIKDNYVSLIQGNIINHFMNHGGDVIFGSKLKVNVTPVELDNKVPIRLKKELELTFNSRKQNVIRWMIDYLSATGINSDSKGKWDYAIIASTLWETMALAVFGNQLKVNKSKYGKRYSFYSISQGKNVKTGSPTQHDVIYEDLNSIYIIDAKMYGSEDNLLSEEVLGKQFGYYKEAKIKEPTKRIVNILLLPTIPEKHESEGFIDYIIEDPHVDASQDPDRIVFVYKCSANEMIKDFYYSRKKSNKIISEFDDFISIKEVRDYLNTRGTSY